MIRQVTYVGDRRPERLLVDYDLLERAPSLLNRAGAGDILSIFTALHDWKLASTKTEEVTLRKMYATRGLSSVSSETKSTPSPAEIQRGHCSQGAGYPGPALLRRRWSLPFRRRFALPLCFLLCSSNASALIPLPKGLHLLAELFREEVVLCEDWGNSRPEEGSEHYIA